MSLEQAIDNMLSAYYSLALIGKNSLTEAIEAVAVAYGYDDTKHEDLKEADKDNW